MKFEWDESKNRQNIEKHAVSFDEACEIFEGFTLDQTDTRFDYGEPRVISIGMLGGVAILTVVHTDRFGVRRLISARQANRKERERYDQALRQGFDS